MALHLRNQPGAPGTTMARARRRRIAAGALGLLVAVTALPELAGGAISTPKLGTTLRWPTTPIVEDRGGVQTGNPTPACATSSTTPRSSIVVTGPNPSATSVFSANSPDKNPSLLVTDRSGPWSTTWNMTGVVPGTYRFRSTAQDSNRTVLCTLQPSVVLSDFSLRYKPWTHLYADFFGGGAIGFDTDEGVVGVDLNGVRSPDSTDVTFFAVPGADVIALPGDPAACVDDPASCLPASAVECEAGAECTPRLALVHALHSPFYNIVGLVDLDTGAMIVLTNVGATARLLVSLGTETDTANRALLEQLKVAAAEQGIDLATLLATKVRVRTPEHEISLSLINALQINPTPAGAASGVQIVSDFTVEAGIILNIYSGISSGGCVARTGDSDPETPAPDRFTRAAAVGYTVEKSDLLPDVPRVGALGALVGGPIYHVDGKFTGGLLNLVNTSVGVISVDTAANEPNGYPVWIEPFLSTPAHTTVPRTMDFIGTATWAASESPVGSSACLVVDFMLGAGVALYNNPLPVGFGTVGIWDPLSPEVAALIDQIDAAVQGLVDQVTADPTVAGLLDDVLAALPL